MALFFIYASAWAAEPIIGAWRMTKQEMTGRPENSTPLILRVRETLEGTEFAYTGTVDNQPVAMITFTSRLDGKECDVKDRTGAKIGSAKVKKAGTLEYEIVMTPANRPETIGRMRLVDAGKTLISESDTDNGSKGKIHAVQVFIRQ